MPGDYKIAFKKKLICYACNSVLYKVTVYKCDGCGEILCDKWSCVKALNWLLKPRSAVHPDGIQAHGCVHCADEEAYL
jgi:hypothetical protein